jgi:hypothetical protein
MLAIARPLAGQSPLSVFDGERRLEWWRPADAPTSWSAGDARVLAAVQWDSIAPGMARGELRLAAGRSLRLRIVLVRFDARRVRITLASTADGAQEWSIDDAPNFASIALNAGQFTDDGVWGWLMRYGVERQTPGIGPLSMAVAVDTLGMLRFIEYGELEAARARGDVLHAFQSYPTLLQGNGNVPAALQAPGRGVDLKHRDARLAIGQLRDGQFLIALTRFDSLEGILNAIPLGPTVGEMAALMGALGCARAVSLDGGISGQLLIREPAGTVQRWPGWRKVRLGLLISAQ